MSTITLDAQQNLGIRTRTNGVDHLLPVIDGLAIKGQQPVAGFQASALRRAFGIDFGQDRRQGRTPWTNTQGADRIGLIGALEPAVQHQFTRRVDGRTLLANQHLERTALAKTTNQLQIHRAPARSRLAINGDDFLARSQTGLGSNACGLDRADDRTHLLAAEHRQNPEKNQRQQEIGNRPRRNDGDALTDGFAIERLIELIDRHFTFALVEHLDVATQRDRSDHELGALLVMPAQQWHAEAHGETQHLDPTATRDPKVAELVEGNQHTQRYQGADNHIERAHLLSPHSYPASPDSVPDDTHRPCRLNQRPARVRAFASAVNTASRSSTATTGSRFNTSSMILAISR
ncbi:hypothetical protein D3C73_810090 [compost metagenome]